MGGGGAIRAATKIATTYGITGLRGASVPIQEKSSSCVRRASTTHTTASVVSSSSTGGIEVIASSKSVDKEGSGGSVHKPSWETDDWEFAGDEEVLLDSVYPTPRIVFGGVPTLEEATEATSELKEALEKEYFSNAIQCKDFPADQYSSLVSSGHSETKACITSENAVIHSSVPTSVFHAFSLLKEPAAQGVVASLASDKNVWDAVMQNDKVMEYIRNQQNSDPSEKGTEKVYVEDSGNGLMDLVEKVKITVTDIISGLSSFFTSLFGGPSEENISIDGNGAGAVKAGVGASFMALAVLTIIVMVMKRG